MNEHLQEKISLLKAKMTKLKESTKCFVRLITSVSDQRFLE